jgi:uncharacterized protein YndB with AHSA1/START domain
MAKPFVIQRLLDAPRALVWEVLTQAHHLPHWLGPKGSSMPPSALEAQDDQTLLTIDWEPYQASAEEVATFEAGFDSMHQGWGGNLDVLEDYLARLQSKT